MINRRELQFFIEDIQEEDMESLFAIRISKNDKVTVTGDKPPYITTVTCIPSDGFSKEAQDKIRESLWDIAQTLKENLEPTSPCTHDWKYDGHGHNYSIYKCSKCGQEEER